MTVLRSLGYLNLSIGGDFALRIPEEGAVLVDEAVQTRALRSY
jgi:hypothetical protein